MMSTTPDHVADRDTRGGSEVAETRTRKGFRGRGRKKSGIGRRERLEIAVLSGPAILIFVTFVILPVIMAAYYGFFRWSGFGAPDRKSVV